MRAWGIATMTLACTAFFGLGCGSTASTDGSNLPAGLQNSITVNKKQVKSCYETVRVEEPELAGKVEVAWTVSMEGAVKDIGVANNTTGSDDLANCLVRRIKRWEFPATDEEQQVTYPFTFN